MTASVERRLQVLEAAQPEQLLVRVISLVPMGRQSEPVRIRESNGLGEWERDAGETAEAFRDRVAKVVEGRNEVVVLVERNA